jgi:hypothetical protein
MGLTMMEVKDEPEEIGRIKKFMFFDVFEAMIQLLLIAFSIFVWATVKAAIWPEEISTASGWTTAITIVLVLVSVQSLLQIAYMTGSRAAETRMALIVAFWAFLILVFVDVFPSSQTTLSEAATHVHALIAQLSHRLDPLPLSAVESLVHIFAAALMAVVSAAMTIPALRYTQTLQQLTMGRSFERSKDMLAKLLLWLEFVSPLFVILSFNPWFAASSTCFAQGHLSTDDYSLAVCPAKDERIATAKLYLQVASLSWMVFLRVLSAKRHLQAFMDVSVTTVTQALMTTNASELQQLRQAVENRSQYMLAAATQLLSVIGVFLALWVTFLRALTHRFLSDLSRLASHVVTQQASLAPWAPAVNQHAAQVQHGATQWLLRNNSALLMEAMQNPATPSLETAVFATMGVVGVEAQLAYDAAAALALEKPSLMAAFLQRVVSAHPLPAITSVAALQGVIFWLTTVWFAVNVLSLGMWVLAPQWFTRTISESNGGGSIPSSAAPQPTTKTVPAASAGGAAKTTKGNKQQ